MLMMLIPGIVVTYYGEEIGMDQVNLNRESHKDIMARYNISVSARRYLFEFFVW